jgi:hypothetical protein
MALLEDRGDEQMFDVVGLPTSNDIRARPDEAGY